MEGERHAPGREQIAHVGPGALSVTHVLHHHARDDEVEAPEVRWVDDAGDVELNFLEFRRAHGEFARVDVVDRIGDPRVGRFARPHQRVAAAANLEHAHEPAFVPPGHSAVVDEAEHARLIIVPGPQLPAVIAEPTQRRGEEGGGAEAALDARPAPAVRGGGGVREPRNMGHRSCSLSHG